MADEKQRRNDLRGVRVHLWANTGLLVSTLVLLLYGHEAFYVILFLAVIIVVAVGAYHFGVEAIMEKESRGRGPDPKTDPAEE